MVAATAWWNRMLHGSGGASAWVALALLCVAGQPVHADFDGDATRLIATLRAEARAYEHGEGALLRVEEGLVSVRLNGVKKITAS